MDIRPLLEGRVPQKALDYCCQLWHEHPFHFKLSRKRLSKLGDYRFDPRDESHTVTVNVDLNVYQFLITYIHEVAHRVVHRPRSRQKPHGQEWKHEFRRLMLPMINPEVFPDGIIKPLARHMRNPKASTAGDPRLVKALAGFDSESAHFTLSDIRAGEEFTFRKRPFRKLEKKRTRSLCLDLSNNKRYLIPEIAEVERKGANDTSETYTLSQVKEGERFVFKGALFEKRERKRTRSLCLHLTERVVYSIHESVEVEPVNK